MVKATVFQKRNGINKVLTLVLSFAIWLCFDQLNFTKKRYPDIRKKVGTETAAILEMKFLTKSTIKTG